MTKNNSGNYDNAHISFRDGVMSSGYYKTSMIVNDLSMHDIFAQLTAQDIVSLIPDQSTLSEVHDELLKVSVYKL